MPRFVRVSSVDNQHRTLFQSKSQFETVNGDIYPRATFMAEDTPVGYCDEAAKDLNWFLAVGGREATVASCQLGVAYETPNTSETMIFPGEFSYRVRSRKSITRQSLEFYTSKNYVPPAPLLVVSYSYQVPSNTLGAYSSTYQVPDDIVTVASYTYTI